MGKGNKYSLNCPGDQNGKTRIANCTPRIDTGIVEANIAISTAPNLRRINFLSARTLRIEGKTRVPYLHIFSWP
jgi:hypothetical protein